MPSVEVLKGGLDEVAGQCTYMEIGCGKGLESDNPLSGACKTLLQMCFGIGKRFLSLHENIGLDTQVTESKKVATRVWNP